MERSKVTLIEAVYVRIDGHRPVPSKPGEEPGLRFEVAKDELLRDFLEFLFQHSEDVESIGAGGSGLGDYSGTFTAESRPAIEAFFRTKGYLK